MRRKNIIELTEEQIDKIQKVYDFINIEKNRSYNKSFQTRYYQSLICIKDDNSTKDKVISLLYHTYNTQSSPKMDKLATFMKYMESQSVCLDTFGDFVEAINPGTEPSYENLYLGLKENTWSNGEKKEWGWGQKTAALFTKVIYHLHMQDSPYGEELRVWGDDAPKSIVTGDKLWLPVDRVINSIFNKIQNADIKKNDNVSEKRFNDINNYLNDRYPGKGIEVWDDLWFWGFITQKICQVNSEGKEMSEDEIKTWKEDNKNIEKNKRKKKESDRLHKWNDSKYWSQKHTSKDKRIIEEIKIKSETFLQLFN